MSSANSRFLGDKPRSPERDTNNATLVPVPSAVNFFPLLFLAPCPGEGASRRLPYDSRTTQDLEPRKKAQAGPVAGERRRAAVPA